jgi:hypothetical protein
MNSGGLGQQVVGGFFVVALAVIGIAAIYQLQQPKAGQSSVLTSGTSIANNTLGAIFK